MGRGGHVYDSEQEDEMEDLTSDPDTTTCCSDEDESEYEDPLLMALLRIEGLLLKLVNDLASKDKNPSPAAIPMIPG